MGGTTNVLSTIGGAISGIFGRANGGTVQANKPYLIGERGAELFVPNTNGTVVPNNQMKSSGTNVNITINTVDARGIDELLTDRRSTIVNLINDALNSQGREALV
jgi:SLT domain-containing protein